ncbi:MAG: anhydro-N-acetylmuramic acid kinase [Pseudomonadota bacterium]
MSDERIRALGAMSGTSLDGIDAAVIVTDGEAIFEYGETAYRPYSDDERAAIRAALGEWDDTRAVKIAEEVVEIAHAELLAGFNDVDVVGFHGQTIAHEPRGRGTRQIGSGDILSAALGLPVVWDFRSADVAMGGEGAPLAPFFHFAALAQAGIGKHLAVLNLGGVGNLTLLDLSKADPAQPGACLAFDTGPANAPINDLMEARRGEAFDRDGALAGAGKADPALVSEFLDSPYFARIPPKSLDRDDFGDLAAKMGDLSDADAAATLTEFVAASAAAGIDHATHRPEVVFVTGGGRHNPVLMARLKDRMPCAVAPIEAAGLNGDMVEAQAFAYLAVRVLRGLPTSAPGTTGVMSAVAGGQIAGEIGLVRRIRQAMRG